MSQATNTNKGQIMLTTPRKPLRSPHPMRIVLSTLTAVLLAGVVALLLTACTWGEGDGSVTVVPPCLTEDSTGPCYWDAETMGNGTGRSFTVDAHGDITYWDGEPAESEPYIPMDEETAQWWQVQDGTATVETFE